MLIDGMGTLYAPNKYENRYNYDMLYLYVLDSQKQL